MKPHLEPTPEKESIVLVHNVPIIYFKSYDFFIGSLYILKPLGVYEQKQFNGAHYR